MGDSSVRRRSHALPVGQVGKGSCGPKTWRELKPPLWPDLAISCGSQRQVARKRSGPQVLIFAGTPGHRCLVLGVFALVTSLESGALSRQKCPCGTLAVAQLITLLTPPTRPRPSERLVCVSTTEEVDRMERRKSNSTARQHEICVARDQCAITRRSVVIRRCNRRMGPARSR